MININFKSFPELCVTKDVCNNLRKKQQKIKTALHNDVFLKSQQLKQDCDGFIEIPKGFLNAFNEICATLSQGIEKMFTKFDTPEIIKAREELANAPFTHLINTPERHFLRKDIAAKLYNNGAPVKEKQAYIIMGPPTSGKSTALCEPIAEKKGAMIIDPDIAKEYLPEYAGGKFAGAVHKESWLITHDIIDSAIQNNDNIVLALVGSKNKEILDIFKKFESADYKIHLRLLDVSPDEAAKRAVIRYDKSGRFVDPYYIYNEVGTHPKTNYYNLINENHFSSHASFSNEVPKGQKPIVVEKSDNISDIFD